MSSAQRLHRLKTAVGVGGALAADGGQWRDVWGGTLTCALRFWSCCALKVYAAGPWADLSVAEFTYHALLFVAMAAGGGGVRNK